MLRSWESADKSIKKDVLKLGLFSKKPTECSTCNITVKNISVTGASNEDLREYHTEILDSEGEKELVIGDASAEVDQKVERALQMMNVFEESLITLTLSVKQQGDASGELITIKFEITLNKCERHKPIWEWSAEEKYQVSLKYKERGIELFKDFRIIDAFQKFSRACKILITLEPIPDPDLKLEKQLESDIKNLRLTLYNNMAMCQLNQKNYEHTVSLCTKILDRDQNNVKALYRRGMAYGNMMNNEKAVTDLKAALILEPNNCAVKEQFKIYNSKLQESIQRSNDMVKRMFKSKLTHMYYM
ncbi:hypothetical protein HN011_012107 [Eciton burchellii]|nr:hypothetical protein HN011_012107 [Eciton burchellii]